MKNHKEKNPESQAKPLLTAALTYASRGWHVFPAYDFSNGAWGPWSGNDHPRG